MIDIHGSWAEVEKEIGRLETMPSPEMISNLEDVLTEVFTETQAATHVITGSLKGSGKTSSEFGTDTWTGTIVYGGESPGFPNNPVDYAVYERARGGAHDFLGNVHLANSRFEDAIEDAL